MQALWLVLLVVGGLTGRGGSSGEGGNMVRREVRGALEDSGGPLTDFDDKFGRNLTGKFVEKVLKEEEVLVRDVVWEAMVTTAWLDYIARLHRSVWRRSRWRCC